MTISGRIWIGGLALSAMSVVAFPAMAAHEIGDQPLRYVQQAANLTCEDLQDAKVCTREQMRWRLCEQGFDAEHLESVAVYQCFLRSD